MTYSAIPVVTIPEYQSHKLALKGKMGTYQITILENSKSTMSDCSCGKIKCLHVLQVIAGVADNLVSAEDIKTQQKLISSLRSSSSGREKIARAARVLGLDESCPICGSNKTKRLKSFSFRSVIFSKGSAQKIIAECLNCNERW